MRKIGIKAIQPRSFVPKTTDSKHGEKRSAYLLEDKKPTRPNEVLVGDITYIAMANYRWAYLAVWQDMFTKKVVGWAFDNNMRKELVIKALEMAIRRQNLKEGTIIHSDGGVQYASKEFRNLITQKHSFVQSMTRRDNHYDNAMAESFFSRLKTELIGRNCFSNLQEAQDALFEYIEAYYNTVRSHSSLNYQTPKQFEENFEKQYELNRKVDVTLVY